MFTIKVNTNRSAKQQSSVLLHLKSTTSSTVIYANESSNESERLRTGEKEIGREEETTEKEWTIVPFSLEKREERTRRKRTHELIMATRSSSFASILLPQRQPFYAARTRVQESTGRYMQFSASPRSTAA